MAEEEASAAAGGGEQRSERSSKVKEIPGRKYRRKSHNEKKIKRACCFNTSLRSIQQNQDQYLYLSSSIFLAITFVSHNKKVVGYSLWYSNGIFTVCFLCGMLVASV